MYIYVYKHNTYYGKCKYRKNWKGTQEKLCLWSFFPFKIPLTLYKKELNILL